MSDARRSRETRAPPREGSHWDLIGFQSRGFGSRQKFSPAETINRGGCIFGLIQVIAFLPLFSSYPPLFSLLAALLLLFVERTEIS